MYSSGSTGFPKGAVHLHHDMVVCHETYARQVLGIRETDKVYSAAKLFFAYGLGNAGYFPMGAGAQSVLYPGRPTPDAVFEILTKHRPTLFFGIPTLYAAMLAVKDAEKRFDLSALRLCVSGRRGAAGRALQALAGALRRGDHRRHRTTEILHIFLSNRPGQARPGSTGQGRARLRGGDRRRRGAPVQAGRHRQPARQGRLHDGLLLEQARQDRRTRSSEAGSRPATSTTRMPTATSGTPGAPTTC
jgi:acyl-coenzyme A synthetase/AMP-(fatty) acid ligase